jgi:UDP-N-acetyl-D-mannosaminuronic acid transferase (WecB/TagA/CpsF family)
MFSTATRLTRAGQAVIQFAVEKLNGLEYAVKFFISRNAFLSEAAQYTDAQSPLRQFLPKVRNGGILSNDDGSFLDGNGRPMPPCIVMEKGESLDVWVQRNKRVMDQFTAMQVRSLWRCTVHITIKYLVCVHAN